MADPKGDKLLVNVAASEARRRLKGFGHGVRKIQSAGRNQALVIHTATDRHLAELESQFADVGFTSGEGGLSEPVANLRNLGATGAQWLRDAGVRSRADAEQLGPVLVYRMVEQRHPEARLHFLYALAAGLQDRAVNELSEAEKAQLRAQLDSPSAGR
ncbi:TfoX/Sxy family DNA transformation protein [Candidatus Laterigemmans baculatus]|uniref:TfoX/Sxy family DNA transformation protein n=1 Tax=Candidatus Laterigemmans baculatus TaxID=2770505 RepID=UPI0013DCB061|nr:TfoX/Sxy family DNA transformation protein [Candidatus Laterigemmans baculatus]